MAGQSKNLYLMNDVQDYKYVRVCIQCQSIYDPAQRGRFNEFYCRECAGKHAANRSRANYAAKRRFEGYIPKSRKRAGRKAYYTRLCRLYFTDRDRFDRLFNNLRKRKPGMAGAVTRKINILKEDKCLT